MTKASDNPFPSILITEGTEPAAPAAGKQRLYIDSTTHKLKRTDSSGTDVTIETTGAITGTSLTMATGKLLGRSTASTGAIEEITVGSGLSLSAGSLTATGGTGGVPGWLSWFIGTTDSTNFYWDGNDLAGFTEQTVTGSTTWAESNNLISALTTGMTADDASCQLIAKSFSTGDAWVLAVNATLLGSDVSNGTTGYRAVGIAFTDGTSTTSNCVIGHLQVDNGSGDKNTLMVGRHGTLTNINSGAPWVSQVQQSAFGNWVFIKLIYQAANTFRLQFGNNPGQFSAFGEADISKTMTPTHVGLFVANANGTHISQASFGPLRKV